MSHVSTTHQQAHKIAPGVKKHVQFAETNAVHEIDDNTARVDYLMEVDAEYKQILAESPGMPSDKAYAQAEMRVKQSRNNTELFAQTHHKGTIGHVSSDSDSSDDDSDDDFAYTFSDSDDDEWQSGGAARTPKRVIPQGNVGVAIAAIAVSFAFNLANLF